jgi:hypothetical protein
MEFDMSKKKDTGPVAAGNYNVTIEKAEEKTYNASMYIELMLRLENRRCVWDRLYSDNPHRAAFACEAAGVQFEGTLDCDNLVGKMVSVEIAIDDTKEKPRNKVISYRAVGVESTAKKSEAVATGDIPF